MENSIEVQAGNKIQSLTRETTRVNALSRLTYIDMIRFVLMVLVIMVHAAVTYGAEGDWTYRDLGANDMLTSVLLSLLVIISQSFFMGLFFFFVGYFTPGAYDRKGVLRFWKDRIAHIAIPMVVYTFALSRIPQYLNSVTNNADTRSFWKFSIDTWISQADGGPTWFLFAILIFTAGYTLVRVLTRKSTQTVTGEKKLMKAPDTKILLLVGLGLAVAMFIICQFQQVAHAYKPFGIYSLLLAFFPYYIVIFIGGILAVRNHWLDEMPSAMLRFWGWFSLGLIIALPVFLIGTGAIDLGLDPYFSGANWRCAGICLWLGLAAISFSTTITLWMRDHVKPNNRFAIAMGPNTFGIYLIHPLALVAVCVWMSSTSIHPLIKFAIASLSTVVVCFFLTEILRRIPIIKKMM